MMAETILVVDDDDIFRRRLARAFEVRGLQVLQARSVDEAQKIIERDSPQKAVIDLSLGNESGLELIKRYSEMVPCGRCLMLTGYGTVATTVSALKLGAVHYLTKPAHADQILAAFDEGASEVDQTLPTPTLSQIEWEHIQKVLSDCGGNITHASKKLGLHRRSLQRKLSKMPEPLT